jgi:hypothetical protein
VPAPSSAEIGTPTLTAESRKGLPGSFVELPTGFTHYELRGDPKARCVALLAPLFDDYAGSGSVLEKVMTTPRRTHPTRRHGSGRLLCPRVAPTPPAGLRDTPPQPREPLADLTELTSVEASPRPHNRVMR